MRKLVGLTLALTLLVAACGDDDQAVSSSMPPDAGEFPATVRGTEIPVLPQRIVSLSATHTEVLYEIGAGPEIIGTDVFSDYPAAANETEKIDAFNLSVEAVAALDPDLVILSFDPGDAVSGLAALGIPAVLFAAPGPPTLEDVYSEWSDLGTATGHNDEAAALIEQVSSDIAAILAQKPETVRAFTYFLELDSTLFTAGTGTLLDSVFGMLGLQNIADPADGPFPQLSPEYVIGADPDFVFLADTVCCGQSAVTVAARPGWNQMTAVNNGDVIELDDSVASRWGPRLVDLVLTISKEVYGVG